MANGYEKPKVPTYARGGERTDINIAREVLHSSHQEASNQVGKVLGKPIQPTDYNKVVSKINKVTGELHSETRANIMSSIENNVSKIIQSENAKLKKLGLPPLTNVDVERLQNNVMKNSMSKFKGATLDKRLKTSKNMANERLKYEARISTDEERAKDRKQKAMDFLTDKRESGRSLIGGSNYKYNERILVSEFNRSSQDAMKEYLKELNILGRWVLSSKHNIRDVCDKIAEQTGARANRLIDKFNIRVNREGVYTSEEIPEYPHPYCQCRIDPVYIDYGLIRFDEKLVFSNVGEDLVPLNDAMISEESRKYYNEWLKREYSTVKPYDYTQRTKEEVERKMKFLDTKTTAGVDGTVELCNKPLEKYVRKGGTRAYEELSKNTVGHYLDEEIVEKIGVDNAIKLLARDIKSSGKAEQVIMALDKYNSEQLPLVMKKSLADAKKFMMEADGYRLQVAKGTPKRAVQGLRTKALVKARQELGDSIGYSEVHERLMRELKSESDIKFLNIPYKSKKVVKDLESKLGLDRKDYRLMTKKGKKYFVIGDEGTEQLSKWYNDKNRLVLSEELDRIRAGKRNRKGWIPANFKKTFIDKSTGKELPFELRPDQQTGIRFIKENKYGMFHYKPGAGKTHTAIGSVTELASEGKVKKALVVVPNDLVRQFQDEIVEFTDDISVRAMTYQTKAKRLVEYDGDQLITVISHNQLKNDADDLAKAGFDMVVVDEIHQLNGDMFKALKGMENEYRVAMTGTAIKDSITDMYDALDWLSPIGMPPKYRFEDKFKDITKASSVYQEAVLRDLRDTLKPLVITKDSPVKAKLVPVYRKVRVSQDQLEDIRKIELQALAKRDNGASKKVVEGWRDRQLGKVVNAGSPEKNAKFQEIQKLIKKHDKEKVIIFASDKDGMKTLQEGLGEGADYYTTSLTKAQRDKMIKEFRSNPDKKVLVLSDAGATGLNLEISNVAIHWDIPDQFYKLEQRMARNWRGLKTDTTYQYLLQSNTTYDSRVKEALEKSKKIAESAKVAESLDEQGVAKVLNKVLRREKK